MNTAPKPIPQGYCPVQRHTREIKSHSRSMLVAMRKLRRDLENCPRCTHYPDCPILKQFNAAVAIAIEQVNAFWNEGR